MNKLFRLIPVFALLLLAACGPKDADIQAKVNEALQSTPSAAATVDEGVATLSGQVADDAARSTAEANTKAVKGVKSVVNNLTVQPAPAPMATVPMPADNFTQGVADAVKDYPEVQAQTADGVITVTGTISAEKWRRLKMSLDALNPKKVDAAGLTVK